MAEKQTPPETEQQRVERIRNEERKAWAARHVEALRRCFGE